VKKSYNCSSKIFVIFLLGGGTSQEIINQYQQKGGKNCSVFGIIATPIYFEALMQPDIWYHITFNPA
jgi:hypothetical protein